MNKRVFYTSIILFYFCLISYICLLILQDGVIGRDARNYVHIVNQSRKLWFLTSINGERLPPPLLLMLMLHAEHYLGMSIETTGLVINLLCGAMCSVICFLDCWVLSGRYSLSLLSGILYFMIPGIRDISVDILRDAPSICLNLSSIYFFISYMKTKKTTCLIMSGFLLALSLGFRYENIEFFFLYGILVIYTNMIIRGNLWNKSKKITKEIYSIVFGAILGACLVYCICRQSDFFSEKSVVKVLTYYSSMFL